MNIAKIQTYWHQFLRKRKVKEMKEDIKHLQEWLDYILTLKNRIINNLMEELEEAEAQYSNNFKAHCIHIDNFTQFHDTWVTELQELFNEDRDEMIEMYIKSMDEYETRSRDNSDYLKTVVFSQTQTAERAIREDYEYFMMRNYEIMKNNEITLRTMIANREIACTCAWRRIAHSVRRYVRRTDARRHRMAEMRKLDAESATEIAENQERIKMAEVQIEHLKKQYNKISEETAEKFKQFNNKEKIENVNVIKKRRTLKKNLKIDERKIKVLSTTAYDCLKFLNPRLKLLEHCLFLFDASKKYETITENMNKWLGKKIGLKYPYFGLPKTPETCYDLDDQADDLDDDFIIEGTKLFAKVKAGELHFHKDSKLPINTFKIISKIFPIEKLTSKRSSAPPRLQRRSGKIRPETSVSRKSKTSSASREFASLTPEKPGVSTLSKVVIQAKPHQSSSSYSSSNSTSIDIRTISEETETEVVPSFSSFDVEGHPLSKLNHFWNLFNKVVIDVREMKGEKRKLLYDNEILKAKLRVVLEAAALRGGLVEVVERRSSSTSTSWSLDTSTAFRYVL